MYLKKIIILLILFLQTMLVAAQHLKIDKIEWSVYTQLPNAEGTTNQYGLAGAISGLCNDYLLVMGGANFQDKMPWEGGVKKYYSEIYIIKHQQSKWLNKAFSLPKNLAYSASVSTPIGVVCIGGENENGLSKSIFIINYNEKNQSTSIVELADLPYPIANAAATLVANIVYLAGGETASGTSNSFMSLDLSNKSNTWKILPSLPQPTSHTVLLSKGKRIFLAGGRSKDERGISDIYNTLYEYDTKWKLKCALPYALSAGTGLVINPNSLVLFGGDKGETFHKVELLLAAIKDEKDASKKQELIEEKTRTQSSHPGFSKEVLVYNINTNKWGTINSIPFDVPVTTLALQYQNEIIIPSGEIRAGVRTPNILMGKINIMKK